MPADVPFGLEESTDSDGVLRLRVRGELDLAEAGELSARLTRLVGGGGVVRLDLSELAFIDSSGLHAVLNALRESGTDGRRRISLEPVLGTQVRRMVDLVGVAPILWPEDGPRGPEA